MDKEKCEHGSDKNNKVDRKRWD